MSREKPATSAANIADNRRPTRFGGSCIIGTQFPFTARFTIDRTAAPICSDVAYWPIADVTLAADDPVLTQSANASS